MCVRQGVWGHFGPVAKTRGERETLYFPLICRKTGSPLVSAVSRASLSCAIDDIVVDIASGMRVRWPPRLGPLQPVAKMLGVGGKQPSFSKISKSCLKSVSAVSRASRSCAIDDIVVGIAPGMRVRWSSRLGPLRPVAKKCSRWAGNNLHFRIG